VASGSFLIYRGCTYTFVERDMNGDGIIDWKDFDIYTADNASK